MAETSFDVVVVGGGVMGLASACSLAERGARVAVLDRGPLAREASWRNFGGVRQSNRDLRELPLARAAARLWLTLHERLGRPTGYRRTGNLRVALDDQERQALREAVEPQRQLGLEIEWLEPVQAREIVPWLSEEVRGATYCPTDGQAEPAETMAAWLFHAERLGVPLLPEQPVVAIDVAGERVQGVRTPRERFGAAVVLNTAGPWSPEIGRMVGVHHPVAPWLAEVLEYDPEPGWLELFLSWQRLSFRQNGAGCLWAGLSSRPYGRFDRGEFVTPEGYELLTGTARRILSRPLPARPRRAWNGITEWTPDAVPIIDAACGPRGYVVATGFSGHGFALSPAVGQVVSELILDGRASLDLRALSNDRFAAGA